MTEILQWNVIVVGAFVFGFALGYIVCLMGRRHE